jgi:hypothetical protein
MFDGFIREHYERSAQDPTGRFDLDGVVELERVDEADVRHYVRDVATSALRPRGCDVRQDQDLFMQGADRYIVVPSSFVVQTRRLTFAIYSA